MQTEPTIQDAYQLAHKLAIEVHRMTLALPHFEEHEEASRLRRSSKAIPVNAAQVFGRKGDDPMYLRFMIWANASCDETIEHLKLLADTGSFKRKEWAEYFLAEYARLKEMLSRSADACLKQ